MPKQSNAMGKNNYNGTHTRGIDTQADRVRMTKLFFSILRLRHNEPLRHPWAERQ